MRNRILVMVILAGLVVPAFPGESSPAAFDKKTGTAFLESIATIFHDLAMSGGAKEDTVKRIEDFLVTTMTDAKKAKDENKIDAVFFARYARLLAIIKLSLAPDPGGILVPIINGETRRFVNEVLGEEWKGSGPGAIGQVANAIADEIVNLQLYMDNLEVKAQLRKAWDEKFDDLVPKKKKESAAAEIR
jgi:hypothetical protein